jgi:S-formylglutathione hydrolase FrmB
MLPPGYEQDKARRYPAAYYLHGLGDNEQSLVNLGGWSIYDRLMRERKIGEFVMLAPAGFRSFYINSRDGKFRYEDFFLHEYLPAMEKKYRIGRTRSERGILGISMGGYGALHYGFKYPEMFAAVSASMPALIEQGVAPPAALRHMEIYFDCGAQDRYGFNAGTMAMDKLLTQRGIPHEAHIYPGTHDWAYVLAHFAASLEAQSKGVGAK